MSNDDSSLNPTKINLTLAIEAETAPPPPTPVIIAAAPEPEPEPEPEPVLPEPPVGLFQRIINWFTGRRILSILLIALLVVFGYYWWQSEQGNGLNLENIGDQLPLNIEGQASSSFSTEGGFIQVSNFDQTNIILQEYFTVENETWAYSPPDQAKCFGEALLLEDNIYAGRAWATPGLTFEDFVLKADSRWVGGTLDGEYGIEIRKNSDTGEFLGLYLHNDGRFTVVQQTRRRLSTIIDGTHEAIGINGEINQIQIEASGETVHFFVNNAYLGTFQDTLPANGGIEFVATAGTEGDLFMAAFDNLVITQNP